MRGAERTFAEMARCWADAPIYTLLYDAPAVSAGFAGREVHSSPLQRLKVRQNAFRYLLPLFPWAIGRLPLAAYDVVVSSSSAFAHGVRARPGGLHVCYCHSPFRYVWHEHDRALSESPRAVRPLLKRVLDGVRAWDIEAAGRVTRYVANSGITQQRIERLYGVGSEIIHPPVAVDRFRIGEPEDFVLFVGQLVRHKRVDVAIDAASKAGRPMKIVGEGPELARLKALYDGPSVDFLGSVDDDVLADLYSRCVALVVPNVEEFGITAVEAQAAGRPVVAFDAGGVRETVVDGETGVLVPLGDASALAEALRQTDFDRFHAETIKSHAESFSAGSFRHKLERLVNTYIAQHDPHR